MYMYMYYWVWLLLLVCQALNLMGGPTSAPCTYAQSYPDVKYLILVTNCGVAATPTTRTSITNNNQPWCSSRRHTPAARMQRVHLLHQQITALSISYCLRNAPIHPISWGIHRRRRFARGARGTHQCTNINIEQYKYKTILLIKQKYK